MGYVQNYGFCRASSTAQTILDINEKHKVDGLHEGKTKIIGRDREKSVMQWKERKKEGKK